MKFPLSTPILSYRKNIYKIQEWPYQILTQAGSYILTEFQNSLLRCNIYKDSTGVEFFFCFKLPLELKS